MHQLRQGQGLERVNVETVQVPPQLSLLMAIQQMKNNYCKGNPGVLLVLLLVGDVSPAGGCSGVTPRGDRARGEGCPAVGTRRAVQCKAHQGFFSF